MGNVYLKAVMMFSAFVVNTMVEVAKLCTLLCLSLFFNNITAVHRHV